MAKHHEEVALNAHFLEVIGVLNTPYRQIVIFKKEIARYDIHQIEKVYVACVLIQNLQLSL